MADVLHLPGQSERSWRKFAATLTQIATENSYAAADVKSVLEELKPMFLEAWEHHRHTEPGAPIMEINEWVNGFAIRLLIIAALAKLQLREHVRS